MSAGHQFESPQPRSDKRMDIMDREPFPFTGTDTDNLMPDDGRALFHSAGGAGTSFGVEAAAAGHLPHAAQTAQGSAPPSSARTDTAAAHRPHAEADREESAADAAPPSGHKNRIRLAVAGILSCALLACCALFLPRWSGAEEIFDNSTPHIPGSAPVFRPDTQHSASLEQQLQLILEKMAQMEKHGPQGAAAASQPDAAVLQAIELLREETASRIANFDGQLQAIREQTGILDGMGQSLQSLEQRMEELPATDRRTAAHRPDFLAVAIKRLGERSYVTVLDTRGRRRVLHPDDMLDGWRLTAVDFQRRAAVFESDDGHRYTSTL